MGAGNYKKSGVDLVAGDACSALAYAAAKATFGSRRGMFGAPVKMEGGFTGALDFGDFYLVFNCDGVGSKIAIADAIGKYDTLGYDLLAMVADDAVCVGAETIAITNTIDTNKVSARVVGPLMEGLRKACVEQKVVVPGGEIGEVPSLVKGNIWNASAVGVVEKKKFITGKGVVPGDQIIGLRSRGFRSNGFSLVRHVLARKFGAKWFKRAYDGGGASGKKRTWGEVALTPSIVYSAALLELLGRYGQKRKCEIKGLANVTGGGIPGDITRVLGKYGANLDSLWPAHKPMLELQKMGNISDEEAYEVWNMGTGMILICNNFAAVEKAMKKFGIEAQIIGEVTRQPGVRLTSRGAFKDGQQLEFF